MQVLELNKLRGSIEAEHFKHKRELNVGLVKENLMMAQSVQQKKAEERKNKLLEEQRRIQILNERGQRKRFEPSN